MNCKILFSITLILFAFLLASGTASAADSVEIRTLADLMAIDDSDENLSRNYILMNDIDVGSEETASLSFSPIGTSISPFTGTFNGSNHTVSNITFSNNEMDHVGFFGFTRRASISDLSLENINLAGGFSVGDSAVGGLIGYAHYTSVIHCSVVNSDTCLISGVSSVGGFVGEMDHSSVSDSSATGNAIGIGNVGGFAGTIVFKSSVSDSSATGHAEGYQNVGGFVGGMNHQSSVSKSSATGNATGGEYLVGGFAGSISNSSASDCSAAGNAKGSNEYVGGFVGSIYNSSVSKNSATGHAEGNQKVGGFAGSISFSFISDNSASGYAEGNQNVGGFVGEITFKSSVYKSSATGHAKGSDKYVGGFVGSMDGSLISDSYAMGNAEGGDYVGGFVGSMVSLLNRPSSIRNSYAIGNAEGIGDYIGGFVGNMGSIGTITDSFYIGAPHLEGDANGIFVTSAELKQINTFKETGEYVSKNWNISSSYDSNSIWYINEGNDYPKLTGKLTGKNESSVSPIWWGLGAVLAVAVIGGIVYVFSKNEKKNKGSC
jgi:The GLUG motif.